jgi:hypothetical protein
MKSIEPLSAISGLSVRYGRVPKAREAFEFSDWFRLHLIDP